MSRATLTTEGIKLQFSPVILFLGLSTCLIVCANWSASASGKLSTKNGAKPTYFSWHLDYFLEWRLSWSLLSPCLLCQCVGRTKEECLRFGCLVFCGVGFHVGFFFFSFIDAVKFRKSQGFFLTTPVCDSGIVLVYIDLFIKLLLPAEKTDISLISYFVPCMFEHCCLWLSAALSVLLSCLTWEELWIQDANALQAEE